MLEAMAALLGDGDSGPEMRTREYYEVELGIVLPENCTREQLRQVDADLRAGTIPWETT